MKLGYGLMGVLVIAATPAYAQSSSGVTVGVTGGTLGVGPEVDYRVSRTIGVRANATFLGVSHTVDSDDITYDGDLKLGSEGVMVDVHPMGNGFRISAGARINNNKVRLAARPTSDVEIGDDTYTPEEIGTLSGTLKAKSFAPALTLGWGGGLTRGLKFGFEAGGMFEGSPRVRNLRATGTLSSDPGFQASLRDEAREIEDDVHKYKIYPIVQLAIGYRF